MCTCDKDVSTCPELAFDRDQNTVAIRQSHPEQRPPACHVGLDLFPVLSPAFLTHPQKRSCFPLSVCEDNLRNPNTQPRTGSPVLGAGGCRAAWQGRGHQGDTGYRSCGHACPSPPSQGSS